MGAQRVQMGATRIQQIEQLEMDRTGNPRIRKAEQLSQLETVKCEHVDITFILQSSMVTSRNNTNKQQSETNSN